MSPRCETLPNGLRVVLVPCEAESVAFGLFVGSGSRHEPPKVAGISHFIEHMLFKGTPSRSPLDITLAIEGRGGNFNACTDEEATCYYAHLPNEYLDEAVDILSDMYLHASIPPDEFVREKGVVIEEIKMYLDEPDSLAMEKMQSALFPNHPLGAPVAGSIESLKPLKPIDLRRYIKSHYLPSNTIAVVAGAFDPDLALRLITQRLGKKKAKRLVNREEKSTPIPYYLLPITSSLLPIPSSPVLTRRPDLNQAQIALGYRTFGVNDERKYAATVLDALLGRGMSSRLFQQVREKRGLSYDISSRMQFFRDAGMLFISGGMDPSKTDLALKVIDRELKRVCEHRVSAAELKRTKEYLIGNFRLQHEKIVAKMFFYGHTMLAFGRMVSPAEQIAGINAVMPDGLQRVAREIFRPANRALSIVTP